jgi:transcriptional regulator with XRE-family HTH domain
MDLKTYLTTKKIKVTDFALTIGVARQTVYSYVKKDKVPSKDTMPKILAATGYKVSAESFYDLTEHKTTKKINKQRSE